MYLKAIKVVKRVAMTDEEPMVIRTREGLEVHIHSDGTVTFSNLPEEGLSSDLVDIILSLNPDAAITCDAVPKTNKTGPTTGKEEG